MTAHEHVFDDLPGLLAGELGRADTGRVSAHLRACDDCRQDLVLAVTAAAALRSAARFAPQAVTDTDDALPDPTRFLAELAAERAGQAGEGARPRSTAPRSTGVEGTGPDSAGPDSTPADGTALDGTALDGTALDGTGLDGAGPEGGRTEPGAAERPPDLGGGARPATAPGGGRRGGRPVPGHRPATGRRRAWWSAAAAAVLLVAGIGAGVLISRDSAPKVPAGREVAMRPVGSWTATGKLTMRGNQVEVDPTNLAPAEPGHYYEVWLVNRNGPTPRLVSVGVLDPGGGDTWTLPGSLLSAYTTVEISYERDDGNPAYSGNSVLRGQYS